MLEQIPAENLEQLYKASASQNFWTNLSAELKGLKMLMATLNFESDDSEKKKSNAAKEFVSNNPFSMYCEFADHFIK